MGAFAAASCRLLFPQLRLMNFFRICFVPDSSAKLTQKSIWIDAVVAAYWLVVLDWLVDCIAFAVEAHVSPNVPTKVLSNVCLNANVYSAVADNGLNAVTRGVQEMLQVGIFAGMYVKYIGAAWMFLLLALVQNVLNAADSRYWQDAVVGSISGICSTLLYWLFVLKIARKNVLTYFIAGFAALIFRRIPVLLGDALPHFLSDVISIILLLLLPMFYALFLVLRKRPADADPVQGSKRTETTEQDVAERQDAAEPQEPASQDAAEPQDATADNTSSPDTTPESAAD
jgi:hypothetical protein